MARLVITGATGFIGGSIIEAALERGHEVVALARNPAAISQKSRQGLQVKRWQLGEALPEVRDVHALVHLAGHIPMDFGDPTSAATCFEANVVGAMELVANAADQGIEKFIHFSSGQIYLTEDRSASEHTLAYPINRAPYYLASKLAGEICVQSLAKRRKLALTVFRLASIYGPGMHSRGMIPSFIRRLSAREVVTLVDGGTYHVDFAYIDDVIDVTFKALSSNETGIFNVGSGVASTSLDAASIVADTLGVDRALIQVEGEAKESGFAALDVTKARNTFDFQPKGLQDGISTWLSQHQETILSR
jgi:UDP-glucose 4-epimerase